MPSDSTLVLFSARCCTNHQTRDLIHQDMDGLFIQNEFLASTPAGPSVRSNGQMDRYTFRQLAFPTHTDFLIHGASTTPRSPTIATFPVIATYFRILTFLKSGRMQATLAFTARPLAVRRSAAQTSARTTLVVRAENKEARTRYVWYLYFIRVILNGSMRSMGVCEENINRITLPSEETDSRTKSTMR